MAENGNSNGRWLALIVVALLALACIAAPLVLHFGQKRHNHLPWDIATLYPAEQAIVPGEVFAATTAAILEHELNGGTGWRPNDFFLWGPSLWADNNSNRQLGILQALRESTRVLKDNLTRVSSNEFDGNLLLADTALRNEATKLWLPSAEGKYREAVQRLRDYIAGLKSQPIKSRPINLRNVELIRLFQAWTDLLGNAHAILYHEQSAWRTDDDFYRAQGNAHAISQLVKAVDREYQPQLANRPVLGELFNEVAAALNHAAALKPLIVFDGRSDGIFANHRRNLDAYISEARQKMYSIRDELEK